MEMIKTIMLDDSSFSVAVGISSVIGNRNEQQDSVIADDDYALVEKGKFIAVLCDGMGGLSGGEKASNLCTAYVRDAFHSMEMTGDISDFYRMTIAECDNRVTKLRDENGEPLKAGTTLASVVIKEQKLHWTSVGDSHIYFIRNNKIQCITNDHNYLMLLNEKVKRGEITQEQAYADPQKESLVSYIGIGGVKYMDLNASPFELQNGDYIILCSDGLYRSVNEEDIKNITYGIGDAKDVAECLTEFAMRAGKRHQDNTSVIVIQCKG